MQTIHDDALTGRITSDAQSLAQQIVRGTALSGEYRQVGAASAAQTQRRDDAQSLARNVLVQPDVTAGS